MQRRLRPCLLSFVRLRQRLGRSGRRGGAAVLRVYVAEEEVTEESPLQDALRAELVQTIAMVQLLLASWYEPPTTGALASTIETNDNARQVSERVTNATATWRQYGQR